MANRMTPPAEGQAKDVLLVLDKQQGKVSAIKGIDKEGNLQTVPPTATHGSEFMQVDKNSDVFSNFLSNFFRKYQDTSGLELFSVKASEAERQARAIEDNHRNPTPEGDKRAEMLRGQKPDLHEFRQGYRFDPAKIDWENLKKVGITADTLKNTKDFDRVMRGYKSRNTYTVSGTVGGFYLRPTDVKLSFYQAKDGTVVPKLHGVQMDEKLLQRPYNGHEFTKQEQGNLQGTGNLGGIAQIKDPKSGEQIPVFVSRDRYTHELEYMRADKWKCPDAICNVKVSPEQKAAFEAGQAVKMENLQFKDGTKRSGTWFGVLAPCRRPILAAGAAARTADSRAKGRQGRGVQRSCAARRTRKIPRHGAAERRYPRRREPDTGSGQFGGQDPRSHQAWQRAAETGTAEAHRQAEREAGQEPESGQAQEVQRNENVVPTLKK